MLPKSEVSRRILFADGQTVVITQLLHQAHAAKVSICHTHVWYKDDTLQVDYSTHTQLASGTSIDCCMNNCKHMSRFAVEQQLQNAYVIVNEAMLTWTVPLAESPISARLC